MARKSKKAYNYQGKTGCVKMVKTRSNGMVIGIYSAPQINYASEGWVLCCELHQQRTWVRELVRANHLMRRPWLWCKDCMEEHRQNEST